MSVPTPSERLASAISDVQAALEEDDGEAQASAFYALGVMCWNLSNPILIGLRLFDWAAHRRLVKRPPEV